MTEPQDALTSVSADASNERAFDEALDLIGELVGYLRSSTSDEEEGEANLDDRARAFMDRYRPAEDHTS